MMGAVDQEQVRGAMEKWVQEWIVGLAICPFARPVLEQQRIHFAVCPAQDEDARFQFYLREMSDLLDADPEQRETTLVVFPQGLEEFEDFLDFHAACEQALVEVGLEGTFQIATFHPQYLFQGEDPASPSHYTNRAPYPTLHLLREESVALGVAQHSDPEGIPARNIALMDELGVEEIRKRLGLEK